MNVYIHTHIRTYINVRTYHGGRGGVKYGCTMGVGVG